MDNTVGSPTQLQKHVIEGTLLGDGYLRTMPGRKDAFLEINHSIEQKEYVQWKYSTLFPFVGSQPRERKGKGKRVAYRFFTRQAPYFTELQEKFYHKGEKIIPSSLYLSPLSLAVWYMDDGSWCRQSDLYLNTQQFSDFDQECALKILANMGIEAGLNKDKEYKRIRIRKESVRTFVKIVKPYIIPSMRYKIGL